MSGHPEYVELVTIVETGDPALIAVVKSVLDDAGIAYFAKGEQLQNLFGIGQFGVGFNPIVGPVELQVRQPDAREARELVRDLLENGESSDSA